jgi:hypothetical protein
VAADRPRRETGFIDGLTSHSFSARLTSIQRHYFLRPFGASSELLVVTLNTSKPCGKRMRCQTIDEVEEWKKRNLPGPRLDTSTCNTISWPREVTLLPFFHFIDGLTSHSFSARATNNSDEAPNGRRK